MSEKNEHLAGPWQAILADREGFAYPTVEQAVEDLGEDYDEEMKVWVARDTGLPADRYGDGELRIGDHSCGDVASEFKCWLVDPDDDSIGAAARYAQAQAMAAGLNAAGGAA